MYKYEWDKKTRGYRLTTQAEKFVASEIRPVYAEELIILGFDEYFSFDKKEKSPLMWVKNNTYFYDGEEAVKLYDLKWGRDIKKDYLIEKATLRPTDIELMLKKNESIMDSLVTNTQRRIKEIYDKYIKKTDIVYIAFSGGKDSIALLDLCHSVLPLSVPVVFSDTTMELPATLKVWEKIQNEYPERKFIKITNEVPALKNWEIFGPPSRTLDWCCSVHKTAPVIIALKQQLHLDAIRALAFLGIRGDESLKRDSYTDDVAVGIKNASQINAMPIYEWGTHELFLYMFKKQLLQNDAYLNGIPRVGCLVCPKASDKYAWFVDKSYPKLIQPYFDVIIKTTTKNLDTKKEIDDYLSNSGWQARRNGLEVKNRILIPAEYIEGNVVELKNTNIKLPLFWEWCKTIGFIEKKDEDNIYVLSVKCPGLENCYYDIKLDIEDSFIKNIKITVYADTAQQKKKLILQFKKIINKSLACLGCRACEADCSFGALKFIAQKVCVDITKCSHCLKCQNIDYGCWRYKSMMVPNSVDSPLKSIANYQNFGLRESWLNIYVTRRESFANAAKEGELGSPMVDSARIWFKQALLTKDSKTLVPSHLLDLVPILGSDNNTIWNLIWIALSNISPLVKWFVTNIPFDNYTLLQDWDDLWGNIISLSAKKSGRQSFCNMLKNTPLGIGGHPVVELTQKGNRVLGLKRIPKSVDPLVILYSLYVMAEVSDRTSFTLSEMMSADSDSSFISPLIAFGMDVDELKNQCRGLATLYPSFISCSFTLGLEEVKIFPKEKRLDDVVDLILG